MKRSYSQFLEGGSGSSSTGPDRTSNVLKKLGKDVLDRLGANTEKFREYCKVLDDFENERISVEDCVARVKEILQGHPDLIQRFDVFLPDSDSDEDSPQGQNSVG